MKRRTLIHGPAAAALAFSGLARAQANWPARPVTIIVPWPAGGGTDAIARAVAFRMQEKLRQSFVIENRPGASGIIGTEATVKAPPDGYTLVLGVTNTHAINPTFFRQLRYDPVKDFQAVALLATGPHVVLVNAATPVATLREFVDYARQRPARTSYGSYGNGSTAHLIAELFRSQNGLDMVHVPYKGIPPAITDLLGNQITLLVSTTGAALPQIKAGKLRAIAVIDSQRMAQLPGVPTMSEQGYKNADYTHWYGLFAPAATPQPLVSRIAGEVKAALAAPDVKEALERAGVKPANMGPQEFGTFVRAEKVRWGRLVEMSGTKGD